MSTKIAWTNETWNPIIGCSKVSEGCKNCYAVKMAYRLAAMGLKEYQNVVFGESKYQDFKNNKCDDRQACWTDTTAFVESQLEKPLKRKKPTMYFVCSMGDLFHESVPFEWVDEVMAIIALCPQHTFQVLTKRPWRMKEYFGQWRGKNVDAVEFVNIKNGWPISKTREIPLSNLWLGTSCENQEMADRRIPVLLQIPAAKRFVSIEPMLGAVDIERYLLSDYDKAAHDNQMTGRENRDNKLNWVICGGESGPGARPMHPDWARSLREQCEYPGVPFFFKQWGEWVSIFEMSSKKGEFQQVPLKNKNKRIRINFAGGFGFHGEQIVYLERVGKKQAGSLLDGIEYKEFPEVNNA